MRPALAKPYIIPLALIGLFSVITILIVLFKPQAERRAPAEAPPLRIVVETIARRDVEPEIASYGRVQARIRTTLVARVGGVVEHISDSFRLGGRFAKGDELLRLDTADYDIEQRVAEAHVAEAESRLSNERALAVEARHNWRSSGRSGEPPPLALREPQLRAAEAALESARANAQRAALNLKRTRIIAPYDGFVVSRNVDLGQSIVPNAALGEIFALDAAEVVLPVKHQDLPLLPFEALDEKAAPSSLSQVHFTSHLFGEQTWQGYLVRGARAIDPQTRQLHVVARIDDPFVATEARAALKVDEYLSARIRGQTLSQTITIPNETLYQGTYVYVLREGRVYRREVSLGWHNDAISEVREGLQVGEQLVLTPLGDIASGTRAEIAQSTAGTETPPP